MTQARGLAPLLVTSPSIRCGTTLLQRLLCSSRNALVYGEEVGKDLDLQLQILASRRMVYAHSRARFADRLERVVRGDGDGWMLDLMPDLDGYLDAQRDGAVAGLAYCRDHALQAGRELWGFKYPGWPPALMRLLFDVVPGTRVIYLHRDLADTARSAKAWGALADEADMQGFCAQWLEHQRFMHAWRQQHPVLVLDFETLVRDPDQAIHRLCAFLPFDGIRRDPLQRRINGAAGDRAPDEGYLPPAALSARESEWVEAATAAAVFP